MKIHFDQPWFYIGIAIGFGSIALGKIAMQRKWFHKYWCMARRFHEWESELDYESIPHMAKEDLVCRTCKETIDWLELLEVIKRIPRQSWMDPECAVCDHTDGVRLLAKNRNWRPEMTAEVLTASFCRRTRQCRKYELRMPDMEAITNEAAPEPAAMRSVECPQCGGRFAAVGAGPDAEVPLCRHCHPGPPPRRVIRFRRREE